MVTRTKQISTVIISVLIVGMLFAIFVLFYDSRQDEITYIVDDNACEWEQGVIIKRSSDLNVELYTEGVSVDDEANYLAQAETENRCIARLGDDRGSFARQLNEQYEATR